MTGLFSPCDCNQNDGGLNGLYHQTDVAFAMTDCWNSFANRGNPGPVSLNKRSISGAEPDPKSRPFFSPLQFLFNALRHYSYLHNGSFQLVDLATEPFRPIPDFGIIKNVYALLVLRNWLKIHFRHT